MSAVDPLLDELPGWILVGGKGGVGKTTCAASLAFRSAARGQHTLLLSTDPARSLAEAIGQPLGAEPAPVEGSEGLHACQLDAEHARDAFLARWRETLITIVDRGTYLERLDIEPLVDTAFPGADEAMALLTLAELARSGRWQRVVVDTAPTGHTLRLLALPESIAALVALLERMQEKHRFMVSALTHRYRTDAADAFLDDMRAQLDALRSLLRSRDRTAVVLVTRPEAMVVAETIRYAEELATSGPAVGALVVNAVPERLDRSGIEALEALARVARGVPRAWVPVLREPPIGLAAIEKWAAAARSGDPPGLQLGTVLPGEEPETAPPAGEHALPRTRALSIVAGKGGVGKTTVACALGIAAASADRPALVVSTDPAPSVADALAQAVGDEETPISGAPGLYARQMDAAAAFQRMRDEYQERIDALFGAVMGGGLDATHDRQIARELFALAPPGIDELYALVLLGDVLEEGRFATIIVDPAPTGHLLRLLEMPGLALAWSHQLMRLMLRYREVGGLGEAAGELLGFAKRTRALGELLRDRERASALVVALDEPLVRAESARLAAAVRALDVDVSAIVWNRVDRLPPALPLDPPVPQFVASAVVPPPRGVDALRRWSATWRSLSKTS